MIYNKLLESIYFLAGKVSKYDAWLKYQNLLKNQWLSQEELEKLQWEKFKAILDYSYRNIPFYKNKFDFVRLKPDDITNPGDFLKIPITTKDELLKENFPLNPKLQAKNLEWVKTSGTSGNPLNWPFDTASYSTKYALFLRGYSFTNWKLGDKTAALWWPGHSSYGNESFASVKNIAYKFFHRRTLLPPITKGSTEVNLESINFVYDNLKKSKPVIFETSTDNLLFLCYFMEENNLSPLKVENVIVIGLLTQKQKENIKKWFSGKVFNRYGPHEMEGIAHECSYNTGLHLSIDSYYLECLKNNKPALKDETGEFVITDLDNYTQPFIRYKIGDSGLFSSKKCPCGRELPLINYLEGRSENFLVTENKEKISPLFMIKFFENYKEIKFFRLIQKNSLKFELFIVSQKNGNPDIRKLEENLKKLLGNSAQIEIKLTQSIPSEPSGKFGWVNNENTNM